MVRLYKCDVCAIHTEVVFKISYPRKIKIFRYVVSRDLCSRCLDKLELFLNSYK